MSERVWYSLEKGKSVAMKVGKLSFLTKLEISFALNFHILEMSPFSLAFSAKEGSVEGEEQKKSFSLKEEKR